MGYSLCMMADFQNGVISRIFNVFWSGFCTEQVEMICRMDFDIFFGILIFDPNSRFCMGYSLSMMADFQTGLISWIFRVFNFAAVFCTEQLQMICRMDFDIFFGILIFDPKSGFFMGYSLCMMADLQNGLIFGIFSVFSSCFFNRTALNDL